MTALQTSGVESELSGLRVALMWSRLGPYHIARATAAEARLRELGASLRLAEVCGSDLYAWDTARMEKPTWSTTLFPSATYSDLKARALVSAVRRWLDESRADVVVINGWGVTEARAALRWVGEGAHRRAVVMSETKFDDEVPRRAWKEWLKRRIVSGAHAGLVGGQPQVEYLSSLGIPADRIFLGYNAVDNDFFARGVRAWRETAVKGSSHGLPASPYFLASARFIARKNLDGLLHAYARYRAANAESSWPLVIAGSGDQEALLKALCKELRLEEAVHWPGFVQYDDLPRLYGGAGAFIHPAKVEPWGLVVNEAAACAIPLLVAAPVGSRYQLLVDGIEGFVFDPFSVTSMADAMLRVSQMDAAQRDVLGAAARSRVEQYGPARFADGLVCAVQSARKVNR